MVLFCSIQLLVKLPTLVTGTGFLGSYVVRALLDAGEEPVFYGTFRQQPSVEDVIGPGGYSRREGDILDVQNLRAAVEESGTDAIVHTAGVLIGGAKNDPLQAIKTNILGIANVLEVARQTGVKKVVYSSSGQVYAMLNQYHTISPEGPVKEDAPVLPGNVYGSTKLGAEYLGRNYSDLYGIEFIALRMPTVYGPWLGSLGRAGAVRDMAESAVRNRPLEVNEYRSEWAHVKDMARACVLARRAGGLKSRVFNTGSGRIDSLQDFVEQFRAVVPATDIRVKPVSMPERWPGNGERAKIEFGYQSEYDIRRGVTEFVEWGRRHFG